MAWASGHAIDRANEIAVREQLEAGECGWRKVGHEEICRVVVNYATAGIGSLECDCDVVGDIAVREDAVGGDGEARGETDSVRHGPGGVGEEDDSAVVVSDLVTEDGIRFWRESSVDCGCDGGVSRHATVTGRRSCWRAWRPFLSHSPRTPLQHETQRPGASVAEIRDPHLGAETVEALDWWRIIKSDAM